MMKTDAEIQKDVMSELKWEPFLSASEIGVAVKKGVVTLSGTVDSYSKKSIAERAAQRITGVKAVAEDIEVKLTDSFRKNDSEIAQTVVNALKWNSAVQDNRIRVKVENGWVTLEGETDWKYQRDAAESAIKYLNGVIGINNNIQLKPVVQPSDVHKKIGAAFQRNAMVDAEKINVLVEGTKVTLTGKVRSLAEKKDAEDAAWMAPGVILVVNELRVDVPVFAD